jgi:outer membrane protein assembly factor BamB
MSFGFWTVSGMAQEWTRFRGPNGSGVSPATTIPVQWSEKDYRWRVEFPGVGHSSPVVWGDRVFVTSAKADGGALIVRALRAGDGQTLWSREFPVAAYPKNKFNSYASGTPAVDEKRLYVTWTQPDHYWVAALDVRDGGQLWRYDLGPFAAEHGSGASPIVFGEMLIVPDDQNGESSIVALDRSRGTPLWKAPRLGVRAAYSTPCVFQPAHGAPQVIVTSSSEGVTSLDAATGKLNWALPLFKNRVVSSPVLAAGLIVVTSGSGGGGLQFFAVRPGDPARAIKPAVAYEIKKGTLPLPYVPTSVSDGRLLFLFGDQGVVSCIRAAGGEPCWRERVDVKFFGSPVLAGDRLYCVARDGQMVVLAAAERYRLLARFDLGEASNATPAIAGGVMYLRTISHVMAIGGK